MPSVLMSVCMIDFIQVSHELNYPQTYKPPKTSGIDVSLLWFYLSVCSVVSTVAVIILLL